jgi:hypothetical protein
MAAVARRTLRMALEGNVQALRMLIDRFGGRFSGASTEGEPLDLDLPRLVTAVDCGLAIEMVIHALCHGDIDRATAQTLVTAIQLRLRALEAIDFERRLAQAEKAGAIAESSTSSKGAA